MSASEPPNSISELVVGALRHYGMDALPAARTSLRVAERADDQPLAERWRCAIAELERRIEAIRIQQHRR